MNKSTSPLTLKRAALIAAIGTTIYTLFEPFCRMIVGDRWWLYFDNHLLCNDIWHIFFSFVLMVSCVVFTIGVLRDDKHFPIFGKEMRYTLLVIALVACGNILWFALAENRRIMDTVPWLYLLFLLVANVVLWYIYIYAAEDTLPNNTRWQKGIRSVSVVMAFSVIVKQILAVIWYAWKNLQFPGIAHVPMFRNLPGSCDWLCNWLILCISIAFFLLVVLQSITTRKVQCKLQKQPTATIEK